MDTQTIHYGLNEPPITLSELRKTYSGEVKPVFGRGTSAGEVRCPKCKCLLAHILTLEETLNVNDITKASIAGYIHIQHPNIGFGKDCSNAGKLVDYSTITIADLENKVIPQSYANKRDEWDRILQLDRTLAGV